MNDLSESLWNTAVGPANYTEAREKYQAAVLEQYKLYVEMADRVSARRNLANTFFLSLNTVLSTTLVAIANGQLSSTSTWVLAAGLAVLLAECAAWFMTVRSYRLLNSAKYAVIGTFEEKLPAYAYSRAEWKQLGEGRDWHRYLPLSHVEQWVPVIFSTAYLLGFAALIV